ncbi:MAG: cytochrome P450 [Myxococcota bacterium]|nr:cytochrome P450 [Myxococcota bacterium]
MADAVPTGLELTALDKPFRENPYPILAKLRQCERVHHDQVFKRYVFTRHDDVMAILRDRDLWSDPRKGNPGTFSREVLGNDDEEPSMLLMDDPGHRRLRELVYRSFTPRAVEQWRSRARAVADRVIGEIDGSEFDLMEKVARPIPTVVIAELLGVDPSMHESFKQWSHDSVEVAFSPVKEEAAVRLAEKAQASLDAFFEEEIRRRRSESGEDLISQLVAAEAVGDRLSVAEVISTCNLLLAAGNLTTTDLIGNGTKAFLDHPDQMEKLRAQPGLMKNAVEEILRYDSPVVNSGRIANADMEIGGVKIARGESLSVTLAAANRDPDVYPEPDRFDIEREDTHHQSFGGGRHLCMGAHLARLEAQETFFALFDRFPEIHALEGRYEYAPVPSFRSLKSLWVRVAR